MTKKRQHDFARVQLKPGRLLGKRRNITETSFKSKKILMPKERTIKPKSEFSIGDCVKRIKSVGNEKDKICLLNDLSKLIPRQLETINTFLPQIFETVLDCIRDLHDGVRNAALKAIVAVLVNTDDLQLKSYANIINNNISAIMKNPNQKITPVSLTLLDCMLKNHPDLICHHISILQDLLPTERKHYTRKMSTEKEAYQYSERGDINALGYVNSFLRNMLKIKNKPSKNENEDEDDKTVYWDGSEPLYLEIYAGGGLKPIDIEEAYAKQFGHHTDPFEEVAKLTTVIETLLKLIPSCFCQIIGSESNVDDNTFRCDPIADLSILIQLLCNVAELAEKITNSDAVSYEEDIAAFLKDRVFLSHRKRFPFELHSVIAPKSLMQLNFLNVSLCFLYMKYLSSNEEHDSDMELIEHYLSRFFNSSVTYEMKCKCIPLFVKMIELYKNARDVPSVVFYLLKQLVILLKPLRVNHPNKKMLMDLLYNMSMLPQYKFWVDSESMELWYEWLLSHCKENIAKLDKKLMRMILKIAKIRHSSFINHLDFSLIKSLLKQRNDDLKESAIILMHNMTLDIQLLKNVYSFMILDSFPMKFKIKFIRMVHVRFTQVTVDVKLLVDFIQFLINIAIDTHNFFNTKFLDLEANKYTKALQPLQQSCYCVIVPSLRWKEHSKLFDVCFKTLRNLQLEAVTYILRKILEELLPRNEVHSIEGSIPMHCALSILKLSCLNIEDGDYLSVFQELHLNYLLTVSVLTQLPFDEEWTKWNVSAIQDIAFTEKTAERFLRQVELFNFGKPDGLVVFHLLRVLKVFTSRGYPIRNHENVECVLQILTRLEDCCTDKNIKNQPVYVQLYNLYFEYY